MLSSTEAATWRRQAATPHIRRAHADDAATIAALGARLFVQAYGDAMDADDVATYLRATYGEAQQAAELREAGTAVWLARAPDGEPAGFAMLRRRPLPLADASPNGAELARIYVDRDWQGHRLGALLFGAAVSEARALGADLLWLSVWQRNPRAIAFYQHLGLRVVGEAEFVVGRDRQRDHLMALPLR